MSATQARSPEWLPLGSDERMQLRAEPSRNLVLASLTVGFGLLIAMSITVSFFVDNRTGRLVSLAVLAVIVGLLFGAYLVIQRREYVLTDQRAYAGVGLREKRISSVDLAAVKSVTVEQSRWLQLVNVGTIRFAAGADADDLAFSFVEDPRTVQQQVLGILEDDGGRQTGPGGGVVGRA
jgi:uncharacterized membrane protein YdbT with pleckstrin-like domain